jgi:hypothetical protein
VEHGNLGKVFKVHSRKEYPQWGRVECDYRFPVIVACDRTVVVSSWRYRLTVWFDEQTVVNRNKGQRNPQ